MNLLPTNPLGRTGMEIGACRPEQVDGWIPAAPLRLTDADLDEIDAALRDTGAGTGPLRQPAPRQDPGR